MSKVSIELNRIMEAAKGGTSAIGPLVFVGMNFMTFFTAKPVLSGSHLASVLDPSVLHSPLVFLAIGLAWLAKVKEKLHPHEMETVYIGSDTETVFSHSTVAEADSHRKPSAIVPKPHHPDWVMADTVHTALADCHWIADEQSVSLKEALTGGKYVFERKFTLPHELEDLVSAELLVLVDNWCTPTINGKLLERKGGKVDLLTWDLSTTLQSGENHVSFEVENNPAVPYLADDPRWAEWNPYGLKYLIRVIHPLK